MVAIIIILILLIPALILISKKADKNIAERDEYLKNAQITRKATKKNGLKEVGVEAVGFYYRGINYCFDCDAYVVEEYNENAKGKKAVAIYSKEHGYHLGYVSETNKRKALNMINKGFNEGYCFAQPHNHIGGFVFVY